MINRVWWRVFSEQGRYLELAYTDMVDNAPERGAAVSIDLDQHMVYGYRLVARWTTGRKSGDIPAPQSTAVALGDKVDQSIIQTLWDLYGAGKLIMQEDIVADFLAALSA